MVGDRSKIVCDRCGTFLITGSAQASGRENFGNSPTQLASTIYQLRRSQMDPSFVVTTEWLRDAGSREVLPDPGEQLDSLLLELARATRALGVPDDRPVRDWIGRLGCVGNSGVTKLLSWLEGRDYCELSNRVGGENREVTLTIDGWSKVHELRRGGATSMKGFMAMQFRNNALGFRVYHEAYVPGSREAGFELLTVEDEARAGRIDDEIEVRIRMARFLLVECTTQNFNAAWEAGFAAGLGKPVIYSCKDENELITSLPFDIRNHRHIFWREDDLPAVSAKLRAILRNTFPDIATMV